MGLFVILFLNQYTKNISIYFNQLVSWEEGHKKSVIKTKKIERYALKTRQGFIHIYISTYSPSCMPCSRSDFSVYDSFTLT